MGFEFGSVAHLDVKITLISFIVVIAFINFFDAATGILEYFLENSKLYGKMIQMIYKELMLMGIVSFIVIITEGAQTTRASLSTKGQDWFHAVDYSHILLFFLTIFFVLHAFYLMYTSILYGTKYKFMRGEPLKDLVRSVRASEKSSLSRILFSFDYFLPSSLRERVEFRLTQVLFRDTYSLPQDFQFAAYLSGCFDRYALKTVHRSGITWLVLGLLAALNYVRVLLRVEFSGCSSPSAVPLGNATEPTTHALSATLPQSAEAGGEGASPSYEAKGCRLSLVKFFLVAGAVLSLYSLAVLAVSRLYKRRLLRKTGLRSPRDYLHFLCFLERDQRQSQSQSQQDEEAHKRELRRVNRALRVDIQHVLDEDEAGGEAEYKELAEAIAKTVSFLREATGNLFLSVKISLYRLLRIETEAKGLLHVLEEAVESAVEEIEEQFVHSTDKRAAETTDGHQVDGQSRSRQLSVTVARSEETSKVERVSILRRGVGRGSLALPQIRKIAQMPTGPEQFTTAADQKSEPADSQLPQRRGSAVIRRLSVAHAALQANTPNEVAELLDEVPVLERYRRHRVSLDRRRILAGKPSEELAANPASLIPLLSSIPHLFASRRVIDEHASPPQSQSLPQPQLAQDIERGPSSSSDSEDEDEYEEETDLSSFSWQEQQLDDFADVYLFGSPRLFYRTVELCITFHCLYLALWMTDFAVITSQIVQPDNWTVLTQLAMVAPIFVCLPSIGAIAETCSLIESLSQLNLEVVHEVLVEEETTRLLMIDLRRKMLAKMRALESSEKKMVDTVRQLFDEIDVKGHGWIDKFHFRLLLRSLRLTFSNDRFDRLYRAVDSSGDGKLEWEELHELLFGHLDEQQPQAQANLQTEASKEEEERAEGDDLNPQESIMILQRSDILLHRGSSGSRGQLSVASASPEEASSLSSSLQQQRSRGRTRTDSSDRPQPWRFRSTEEEEEVVDEEEGEEELVSVPSSSSPRIRMHKQKRP